MKDITELIDALDKTTLELHRAKKIVRDQSAMPETRAINLEKVDALTQEREKIIKE